MTEPQTIDETAAQWCIRFAGAAVTPAEQRGFEKWLGEAPEHRAAYDAMERTWTAAAEQAGDPDILAMREVALRYTARQGATVGKWMAAAAAVVVAVGAALASWQWSTGASRPLITGNLSGLASLLGRGDVNRFQTAVGQRSMLRLIDGSAVTLNTASRIEADFSGDERLIHLVAGQALFNVARDPKRPFTVLAGDRKISVLGTSFDVRVESRQVRITLVDGKIAVGRAAAAVENPAAEPALQIQPGEQIVARVGGGATVQATDVQRDTSWREGRLIFKGDRLADAIAEMNRYSRQPIVIADPGIGELRLSGVYRTGEPEAFAQALSQYFPVVVTRQSGATVLSWLNKSLRTFR